MNITPQAIKDFIALIPSMDNDTLSHTYKCLLTSAKPAELKQLEPFMQGILKELRSRTKVIKDEPAKEPEKDMYESQE